MEQANYRSTGIAMHPSRTGASRKLLTRKAMQQSAHDASDTLEASFPTGPLADAPVEPISASSSLSGATSAHGAPAPAAWSNEDEAAFQTLLARRKAAGYRRRGKDLAAQLLTLGPIKPNPDTVAATIVALIGKDGEISRGELLSRMATAIFPHPKARAEDEGWCQGYIAGAIRNGFLAIVAEHSTLRHGEG